MKVDLGTIAIFVLAVLGAVWFADWRKRQSLASPTGALAETPGRVGDMLEPGRTGEETLAPAAAYGVGPFNPSAPRIALDFSAIRAGQVNAPLRRY